MTDMTRSQKHAECLDIIIELKEKITNEKAVYPINCAVALIYKWINEQKDVSYELYDLLDNEENGFTIFQESENDEKMRAVWNCLIDAVAYICRDVFDAFGAKYYPEPIALVDEDTFLRLTDTYDALRASYTAGSR